MGDSYGGKIHRLEQSGKQRALDAECGPPCDLVGAGEGEGRDRIGAGRFRPENGVERIVVPAADQLARANVRGGGRGGIGLGEMECGRVATRDVGEHKMETRDEFERRVREDAEKGGSGGVVHRPEDKCTTEEDLGVAVVDGIAVGRESVCVETLVSGGDGDDVTCAVIVLDD